MVYMKEWVSANMGKIKPFQKKVFQICYVTKKTLDNTHGDAKRF